MKKQLNILILSSLIAVPLSAGPANALLGTMCAVGAIGTGIKAAEEFRNANSYMTAIGMTNSGRNLLTKTDRFISGAPATDNERITRALQDAENFSRKYGTTMAWGSSAILLTALSLKLILK